LTLLALVLAFWRPGLGERWFRFAEDKFKQLARRQRLAVLIVGLVAVTARIAVLPILPVPQPGVADEYSFLLGAETFAHGRVTNPTPRMWIHFETLHTIVKPTYMSMYPPAQGLFLAAGLVLAGTAFVGVLLSVGLMCAAICWMLQGWFSPGWALLGGLLAVVRLDVFNYWANSYWGGAVAALGGALALGALPRILKHAQIGDALWMGAGLILLANSRPYAGLIFSLPLAVALFLWLWKNKTLPLGKKIGRVVVPLTLVLTIAGAAMGYYFWRVTGSPFKMPEEVFRDTYAVAPYFLWQSPRPVPVYHNAALRHFFLHGDLPFYEESRTLVGLVGVEFGRCLDFWLFYLGPALTLPLLLLPASLPLGFRWSTMTRPTRFLILASVVSTAGIAVEAFFFPHYAAPMTGLVLALVILAMRQLRGWRWHDRPVGRFVTRAVPAVCLLMLALRAAAVPLHIPITPTWPPSAYNSVPVHSPLVQFERKLDSYPGKHLVIVVFSPDQKSNAGFVHNSADIEQSRIIWAWDMGAKKNEELIRYYKNRDVWLMDPLEQPPRLLRYTTPALLRIESAASSSPPATSHTGEAVSRKSMPK
jgi:hypothetical protein